ncbi:MAG: sigma-70 family RNA polymerase sigma factor [Pyrinomonadaceae bacterium]
MGRSITFDESEATAAELAGMPISVQNSSRVFVERLRSGDADAFDQLVTKFASDVFSLAFRLTNDREDANDIVQETFLSAVNGIAGFRGDAELKTWLFRITVNHARNKFRWWKRRRRDRTVSLDDTFGDNNATEFDRIADEHRDPEAELLIHERETAIFRELATLPLAFREAVVLCDIEGYSYEEIAGILGVGIGTVKSRIARGRGTLRERLRDF